MIKSIYIAAEHKAPVKSVEQVELVAGKGIVGDRNFGKSQWPGQNVTFIEAEKVAAFNAEHQRELHESDLRRTVITQGVDLNALEGKEFQIGDVRFIGVELCEPCAGIGELLATEDMPKQAVVKAFLHKAGLRANVLNDGRMSVGMSIEER